MDRLKFKLFHPSEGKPLPPYLLLSSYSFSSMQLFRVGFGCPGWTLHRTRPDSPSPPPAGTCNEMNPAQNDPANFSPRFVLLTNHFLNAKSYNKLKVKLKIKNI